MNEATIEELLSRHGALLDIPVGTSMLPMLKNRQTPIVIEPIKDLPRNNDVVLYKRSDGQYVLHRIVKITSEYYITRGDNCYGNEQVSFSQMIGILKGYYKGERYIDCRRSNGYRMYVWAWRCGYPFRLFFMKARSFWGKTIGKRG